MYQPMQRAALGRVAKIGALYDIRTESFLRDTLFGLKLDEKAIDTMDLGDTSIELVLSDDVQEKFNQLQVEAELQVSLMAGMVKLSGSGSYLGEERKSARAQSMSLLYKLRTVNEEMMLRQNKDKIDMDILSPSSGESVIATHAVVAIDWGAVCSVTCEYENKEDEDETKVKGSMKAELEKLKVFVNAKGSAKVDYDSKSKDTHKKFTFKCKSDVSATDKDLPVTFEGAVDLARSLPSLVEGTNNGKGVPLTYMLMPLDAIIKMCRLQVQIQTQYREIDESTIKKCAQVVEGITKKRQTLYDLRTDIHDCEEYVAEGSLEGIDDIWGKYLVEESSFTSELQRLVKKVRSGDEDVSALEAFLSQELSATSLFSGYNDTIRGFQQDLNKVKSIKSWKTKGIIYVGRKEEAAVNDTLHVYILYKTARGNDEDNHEKNVNFFLRLQKTYAQDESYKFIVVDQYIRNDIWPACIEKTRIYKFKDHGKLTSSDVYSDEGKDLEMCLIKLSSPKYQQIRPVNRARVKLKCPDAVSGNGDCTGNPVIWMCSKCKQVVEYGIETKLFYCNCGESDPQRSLFRCNEKEHGIDYVRYPYDILKSELTRLRPIQETNILILGETGVGKSTWINGFMNYLLFNNLEEATKSKEFHVPIPSRFTFTQKGKEHDIQIGKADTNERMETGKSATKEPRSYVFNVGDQKIRLIDTPGVGDSDGIQQDKKNFDNILSYLAHYEEIHAVCILLKPNDARLTAVFRFCIRELLAHLHSSAKHNLVFCFTNARATMYEPGDTLPSLNAELRNKNVGIQATPHNYFCFDNEAFRFLACLKSNVTFGPEDVATYSTSWDKSVAETTRLFNHIRKLRPHKVRNTLNMNEARRIILAMSKPLAEVAKTIQQNVQTAEDARDSIDRHDKSMAELEAHLKIPGFGVEHVPLDYPRTVCAHPKCVKSVPVGKSRVQNNVFSQICHHHCSLTGIPTETTNDPRLQGCACVWESGGCGGDGTYCGRCTHHFKEHMHITYSTKVVKEEYLSEEVQAEINEKKSAKGKIEAFKKAIDVKNRELEEEQKIIMTTSAKYGSFLKANAIIPYNDAIADYLDMSIELEQHKPRETRNDELVVKLQSMMAQYEEERKILDGAIADKTGGNNIHTPEEVKMLQKDLFRLKHKGQTLKDLFDPISITRSARNVAFQEMIAPMPQTRLARNKAFEASRALVPHAESTSFPGVKWVQNKMTGLFHAIKSW